MIRRWTQNRNETIRGSNRSIVQDCYMSGPIGRLAHLVCKAAEPIAIKVLLSCGAVVCSVLIGGVCADRRASYIPGTLAQSRAAFG